MKRVTLFRNGSTTDGKVNYADIKSIRNQFSTWFSYFQDIPLRSYPQLLAGASEKFNIKVKRIFTAEGGEIDSDSVKFIQYVTYTDYFHLKT